MALMLLILLAPAAKLRAQAEEDAADLYRQEARQARAFDAAEWERLHGDLDYTEQARAKPKPSQEKTRRRARPPQPVHPAIKVILLVLVSALLAWFLWKIIANRLFIPQRPKHEVDTTEEAEAVADNLLTTDPEAYISQAESKGYWHLAVHLHYLALLKQLHQGGQISWRKNKTNRDYLLEAARWDGAPEFGRLTLAYERIWYGLHYPQPSEYQVLAADFITLRRAILPATA